MSASTRSIYSPPGAGFVAPVVVHGLVEAGLWAVYVLVLMQKSLRHMAAGRFPVR